MPRPTMKLSFRDWLLQKLLVHRAISAVTTDGDIAALAKKLGVQPDLLVEARAVLQVEQAKRGRSTFRRRSQQVDIWIPHGIWRPWLDECAYRHVESPVLIRSLIHAYLLSEREPRQLLHAWRWRDRDYPVDAAGGGAEKARTQLTHGAWRALRRRGMRLGVDRTAIIRGLILETLDGAHPRVEIVDAVTMFDDEARYVIPS